MRFIFIFFWLLENLRRISWQFYTRIIYYILVVIFFLVSTNPILNRPTKAIMVYNILIFCLIWTTPEAAHADDIVLADSAKEHLVRCVNGIERLRTAVWNFNFIMWWSQTTWPVILQIPHPSVQAETQSNARMVHLSTKDLYSTCPVTLIVTSKHIFQ